jgi:heme-degrading monooxygenase HmoA
MTITEIALVRLLPPTSADDVTLRSKLGHAKVVMEKYTGRKFYYLQQIEDPSLIYIVGEWDSLDQHMNDFIPSADNQAVLESLKTELTVEWLLHADTPHANLPFPPKTGASGVYSITRHFVKSGEKEKFMETFEANKHLLQEYVSEGTIGGGWRLDKEDGKEEFDLFIPWTEMEQHFAFGKSEAFLKYAQIRDHIDDAEIKHAKLLDI